MPIQMHRITAASDETFDTDIPEDDDEAVEVDTDEGDGDDTAEGEESTARDRLENSVEDDSAHMFAILESFIALCPNPASEQLRSLADALALEGEDREDFILIAVDLISGGVDLNVETDANGDQAIALEDGEDDDAEEEEDDEEEAVEDDDEPEEEDDEGETQKANVVSDSLSDALNNDGQSVDVQPNVDDTLVQHDGELDFDTLRPNSEPPPGTNDGAPMETPV